MAALTAEFNLDLSKFIASIKDVQAMSIGLIDVIQKSFSNIGNNVKPLDLKPIEEPLKAFEERIANEKINIQSNIIPPDTGSLDNLGKNIPPVKIKPETNEFPKAGEEAGEKFKDKFNSSIDGLKGSFGAIAGIAAGAFAGKELFDIGKDFVKSGSEMIESSEKMKVAFAQAGIPAEQLDAIVKKTGDGAVELADKFAMPIAEIKNFSQTAAAIGGATGKANEDLTQLAIGVEKASNGMVSGEMAIRIFSKGVSDPESQFALGRLTKQFPALGTAMKDIKDPAEATQKALAFFKPTFKQLEENAQGPVGAMQRMEQASGRLKGAVGTALIEAFAPLISNIANILVPALTSVVSFFRNVADSSTPLAITVKVLGAAFGVASLAVVGMGISSVIMAATTIPAIGAVTTAFGTMAAAVWSAIAPLLPFIAIAAALGVAVYALSGGFNQSTESKIKDAKETEGLIDKHSELIESNKKLENSHLDLIDSWKSLGEKANKTAEEQSQLNDMTVQLSAAYPGVIAGGNTFEQNLVAIESQAEKSTEKVKQYDKQLDDLYKQKQGVVTLEVKLNEKKAVEDSKKLAKDIIGGFWRETSTDTNNRALLNGLITQIDNAKNSDELQKAQIDLNNKLGGMDISDEDKMKFTKGIDELVKSKNEVLGRDAKIQEEDNKRNQGKMKEDINKIVELQNKGKMSSKEAAEMVKQSADAYKQDTVEAKKLYDQQVFNTSEAKKTADAADLIGTDYANAGQEAQKLRDKEIQDLSANFNELRKNNKTIRDETKLYNAATSADDKKLHKDKIDYAQKQIKLLKDQQALTIKTGKEANATVLQHGKDTELSNSKIIGNAEKTEDKKLELETKSLVEFEKILDEQMKYQDESEKMSSQNTIKNLQNKKSEIEKGTGTPDNKLQQTLEIDKQIIEAQRTQELHEIDITSKAKLDAEQKAQVEALINEDATDKVKKAKRDQMKLDYEKDRVSIKANEKLSEQEINDALIELNKKYFTDSLAATTRNETQKTDAKKYYNLIQTGIIDNAALHTVEVNNKAIEAIRHADEQSLQKGNDERKASLQKTLGIEMNNLDVYSAISIDKSTKLQKDILAIENRDVLEKVKNNLPLSPDDVAKYAAYQKQLITIDNDASKARINTFQDEGIKKRELAINDATIAYDAEMSSIGITDEEKVAYEKAYQEKVLKIKLDYIAENDKNYKNSIEFQKIIESSFDNNWYAEQKKKREESDKTFEGASKSELSQLQKREINYRSYIEKMQGLEQARNKQQLGFWSLFSEAAAKAFGKIIEESRKALDEQIQDLMKLNELHNQNQKLPIAGAAAEQDLKITSDIENKKQTIYKTTAALMGESLGQALVTQKKSGKAILQSMLSTLQAMVPILSGEIFGLIMATPWSASTAGIGGLAVFAGIMATLEGLVAVAGSAVGHKKGGYTGNVPTDQQAGIVHGQEFVINAENTAKHRNILEAINTGTFDNLKSQSFNVPNINIQKSQELPSNFIANLNNLMKSNNINVNTRTEHQFSELKVNGNDLSATVLKSINKDSVKW